MYQLLLLYFHLQRVQQNWMDVCLIINTPFAESKERQKSGDLTISYQKLQHISTGACPEGGRLHATFGNQAIIMALVMPF